MLRIAVLASGRGSNLQALWQASVEPNSQFTIITLLSNNEQSQALQFAKSKNIPHLYTPLESQMLNFLDTHKPDLICLAGYMQILSPKFVQKWSQKIINIHPSLLPKYKGLQTHRRTIEAGDKQHGATLHYVTEKLDDGEIISQCHLDILPEDTPETLAARLLPLEHKLYVSGVKKLAEQV